MGFPRFFQYFKVILEILWESLGVPLGTSWEALGTPGEALGPPWEALGTPWQALGTPWGRFGIALEDLPGKTWTEPRGKTALEPRDS